MARIANKYIQVSTDEGVLNVLAGLVDKSLVTASSFEDGEMRYLLLEIIRQ